MNYLLFVVANIMDIREITKQNKQKDTANAMSLCWVPGGTRTHDIQNHNLTL